MRTWQGERRQRTRHLIELGGLVVKAGVVDLTGDDRATSQRGTPSLYLPKTPGRPASV
jgi:hypothetical protein